ncbi:threonine/serine exporter family protein [Microbacterium sp. SD291]|uniref:threonine/serine exporter family protein n=1 Tax=Microbacterium sp. SD291 TaxID=2782007 RepID=UPI001A9602DE|nr:threonine/serine exporter family protein [Microbacterium sp. SD291]MBO0981141.1 threonine/serine exporter family protein [Microbacterium sp. SD291]
MTQSSQFAQLGALLLEAGFSATDTREALEEVRDRVAPEHEMAFAVLPEAVFVSPIRGTQAPILRMTLASSLSTRQSAMVSRLMHRLRAGRITLETALGSEQERIRGAVMRMPMLRWVVGNALLAGGLAVLFRCPWWSILVAALVAALVGGVAEGLRRIRPAAAIIPFLIALLSTVLVSESAAVLGYSTVPLFAVCAPIAILVPGAMITNALLELTAADVVAGASRLVYGVVQLAFMAAGIAAGSALIGLEIDQDSAILLTDVTGVISTAPAWASLPPAAFSWFGVAAVAVGISLAFGAGYRLTAVSIAAMGIAYALLFALAPFWGNVIATGATAAVLFALARLIERSTLAIPATITFQPAFLLLVPGTVGLVALASFDVGSVPSAPAVFVSLCIGTKVGSIVTDTHWWRLLRLGRNEA